MCGVCILQFCHLAAWSVFGIDYHVPYFVAGTGPVELQLEAWDSICEWVLGRPLQLWRDLFQGPFLVRAKELVASSFSNVGWVGWGHGTAFGQEARQVHDVRLFTGEQSPVAQKVDARPYVKVCDLCCSTCSNTRTLAHVQWFT